MSFWVLVFSDVTNENAGVHDIHELRSITQSTMRVH